MKKLMIAASAALCAAVGFSAGEVQSAEIVGYSNKTCPANKFVQVAMQFEDVASGLLAVDKIMSGIPGVTIEDDYETFLVTASQIQIVKEDGNPDIYFYLNDGWYDAGGDDWRRDKPGWCDAGGNLVDLKTLSGQGFWLWVKSPTAEVMQGAGQVPGVTEVDVTAQGGIFSINGGVFPVAINLNDPNQVSYKQITGVTIDEDYETFLTTAPQIQVVREDGNPDIYFYLNDGWYDAGGDDWRRDKPGWCDAGGNLVDVVIQPQGAFWVWAKTGAITFTYKR